MSGKTISWFRLPSWDYKCEKNFGICLSCHWRHGGECVRRRAQEFENNRPGCRTRGTMQERELAIPGGSLYYEITDSGVRIIRYQGLSSEVQVPDYIENAPVTVVGKKAFLSKKNLRRVTLPDTVEELEDWAFAYCNGLIQVTLPRKHIRFGRAVFLECSCLQQISDRNGLLPGELLAAAVRVFDAYYLMDMQEAGSGEWLRKWDARLLDLLHTSDQEGYSKQVLCGEEDYGSTDLGAYVSGRRKVKARLALLRCLHSQGLSEVLSAELTEYLRAHTKGEESQETWQVVLEEHGEHREYYSLFAELGCVNRENLDGILSDIGDAHPEMKAYFLKFREEQLGERNFFDDLSL